MPAGRPSKYTEKMANQIIDALISGKSIVRMCKQDHWPSFRTICNWRRDNKEFLQRYEEAYMDRAEYLADEMLEIADDTESDVGFREDEDKDGKGAKEFIIQENTAQRKLKLETRKWVASHLMPNKWGDFSRIKQDNTHTFPEGIEVTLKKGDNKPEEKE